MFERMHVDEAFTIAADRQARSTLSHRTTPKSQWHHIRHLAPSSIPLDLHILIAITTLRHTQKADRRPQGHTSTPPSHVRRRERPLHRGQVPQLQVPRRQPRPQRHLPLSACSQQDSFDRRFAPSLSLSLSLSNPLTNTHRPQQTAPAKRPSSASSPAAAWPPPPP